MSDKHAIVPSGMDKVMKRMAVRFLIYGAVVLYLALDLYWVGGPLQTRFALISEGRGGIEPERIVAHVYGVPITIENLDEEVLMNYYRRGGGGLAHPSELSEASLRRVRAGVLDMLIYHRAIEGKLRVKPILMREEEIEGLWRDAALVFGGEEAMVAAIVAAGLDVGQLREDLAREEQVRRWVEKMIGQTDGVEPDSEAIEGWYARHEEYLGVPAAYRLRHLYLSVDGRDDEELVAQLEGYRLALEDGADFAEFVEEFGEDPGSMAVGGELGWCLLEELPAGMGEVVLELESGGVSGPVRTSMGWHLVELIEKQDGRPATLEEWEERIRFHLLTMNRRYVIHQLRGHLHKDAGVRVFPDNLSQAWSLDTGLSEGKE